MNDNHPPVDTTPNPRTRSLQVLGRVGPTGGIAFHDLALVARLGRQTEARGRRAAFIPIGG